MIRDLKKSSFVARIVTDKGIKKALKSLYISPDRQLFITHSEQLLAQKGVDLARPTPTLKGKSHTSYGRVPYVLYDWIDGQSKSLRNRDNLEAMVRVMARLHYASRRLNYHPDITISSHPDWEKEYRERIKNLERWFNNTKSKKNKKYAIIHRNLPFFIKMAKIAGRALKESHYQDYRKGPSHSQVLVHGDFHQKNLIFQGDKGILIDFEDVRYDLPSKDLLRLFSMYTKRNPFHEPTFRSMMETYESIHPLSSDVKKIVYIDFLFPHIFERMLRKKKYSQMSIKRLKNEIKQEKKKATYVYRRYFKIEEVK